MQSYTLFYCLQIYLHFYSRNNTNVIKRKKRSPPEIESNRYLLSVV